MSEAEQPLADDGIQELVRRAQGGDLAAATRLYETIAPRIFTGVALRLRELPIGAVDAEDVVQEAWLRALTQLESYEPRGSFAGWVFTIAKNVLLELWRVQRRLPRARTMGRSDASSIIGFDRFQADTTTIGRKVARRESIRALVDRLAAATDLERDIFVYVAVEERGFAEVALRLGLTRDAVAKRWQRLKHELAGQKALFPD